MECPEAHVQNDADAGGSRTNVAELTHALAEQRVEVELLKQICFTVLQEVRALSARVGTLTDAPSEGESPLDQAIARVVKLAFQTRMPIIGDLITLGIAEQFEVIALRLDASTRQLMGDADYAIGAFRESVAVAAEHVAALGQAADVLRTDVAALDIAGRETAVAGAKAVAGMAGAAARVNEATQLLASASAAVTDAASDAARRLDDATSGLTAETSTIVAAARGARDVSATLAVRSDAILAASEAFVDGGQQTASAITVAAGAAVTRLATMIQDAETGRMGLASVAQLAERLENVAVTLVDGAYRLDGSALRITEAGEDIANRLAADAARGEALLTSLPDMAAEAKDAAMALRRETAMLRTAAAEVAGVATDAIAVSRRDMGVLQAAASEAEAMVTAAAARAESSAVALDRAGRLIGAASETLAAEANRLAAATPVTEAAGNQNEALTSIAELLSQMSDAVRRIEAGVDAHDKIWATVNASVEEVREAALAMTRGEPGTADPATLVGTLRHADAVARESEMLLRHAEILAEAVLSGRSGVPDALSRRLPELLTEIDAAARRLRSAATALALAGDGAAMPEQRIA